MRAFLSRFSGSNRTRRILSLALAGTALVCCGASWNRPPTAPLTHGAHIWQRKWTGGLRDAIRRNWAFVAEWMVLAAEVEFRPDAAPRVARVAPDQASFRESQQPFGFAIPNGPAPDGGCRTSRQRHPNKLAKSTGRVVPRRHPET